MTEAQQICVRLKNAELKLNSLNGDLTFLPKSKIEAIAQYLEKWIPEIIGELAIAVSLASSAQTDSVLDHLVYSAGTFLKDFSLEATVDPK